jgi:hypothetical protein
MFPEWEAKPKDEFAISINAKGKKGCINLDNLYHEIRLNHEPKQLLVQHFLSEFARVIGNTENPSDNWDLVKNKISLVVRPTNLYSECLGNDYDEQLAFSLPVLPDLALYWVVENNNSWQYITNAHFSKWNVHSYEVQEKAYENTCKSERCMSIGRIGDVGLLIFTKRKMGTVSQFLYEPMNIQNLIHKARPDWSEKLYWSCIPVPDLIILTKEGNYDLIKQISPIFQERYGKALSNKIYVFSNNDFSGEVILQPGLKKPIIMDFERWIPPLMVPN